MGFRDDTEALRARIEMLERDLEQARGEAEELEATRRENIVLKAKVEDLERRAGGSEPKKRPLNLAAIAITVAVVGLGIAGGFFGYDEAFGADPDAPPTRGLLDLSEHPSPPPLSSVATGEHDADSLVSGCVGHVPERPVLVLRAAEPENVRIWTESRSDLVLVVRSESGEEHCDDDSGRNLNASLSIQLGAGDHRVWVGTYEEDARADYALHVETEVDLDDSGLRPTAQPTVATLRPDEALFGRSLDGSTQGEVPAVRARAGCAGHVPLSPHVRLELDEPRQVRVGAHSEEDLVLLLQRADGSFVCDDDGGEEYDPLLNEDLPPGRHLLWVGTYQPARAAEFDLTIDATRAGLTRDGDDAPRLGRWDLTGEPLLSFSGVASPTAPVQTTQPGCRDAWGSGQHDLELVLGDARTVSLEMHHSEGPAPSLLVEHPDGTQSCTGPEGLPPMHFGAGTHRVWVTLPSGSARSLFTLVAHAHPE